MWCTVIDDVPPTMHLIYNAHEQQAWAWGLSLAALQLPAEHLSLLQ